MQRTKAFIEEEMEVTSELVHSSVFWLNLKLKHLCGCVVGLLSLDHEVRFRVPLPVEASHHSTLPYCTLS